MNLVREVLLWIHLVTGMIALVLFWVPALTKKGGRTHRSAGRWYVRAMWSVVGTAIPLSVASFWTGEWFVGVFLAYLGVITFTSLWVGTAVLGVKPDAKLMLTPFYAGLGISNVLAAILVLVVAWTSAPPGFARTLLSLFSIIGLSAAWDIRKFWLNPPADRQWWRYEHLGGMIGTGIAAHTAFGAFGLRRLLPELQFGAWGLVPWIAPSVIGTVTILMLTKRYKQESAAKAGVGTGRTA